MPLSPPYNLNSACCFDLPHVFSRCIVRYCVCLEFIHLTPTSVLFTALFGTNGVYKILGAELSLQCPRAPKHSKNKPLAVDADVSTAKHSDEQECEIHD